MEKMLSAAQDAIHNSGFFSATCMLASYHHREADIGSGRSISAWDLPSAEGRRQLYDCCQVYAGHINPPLLILQETVYLLTQSERDSLQHGQDDYHKAGRELRRRCCDGEAFHVMPIEGERELSNLACCHRFKLLCAMMVSLDFHRLHSMNVVQLMDGRVLKYFRKPDVRNYMQYYPDKDLRTLHRPNALYECEGLHTLHDRHYHYKGMESTCLCKSCQQGQRDAAREKRKRAGDGGGGGGESSSSPSSSIAGSSREDGCRSGCVFCKIERDEAKRVKRGGLGSSP
jgi:hypothetical protein